MRGNIWHNNYYFLNEPDNNYETTEW
jgi:hypothetical protein